VDGDRGHRPRVAVIGCGAWGRNLVRNFYALGALEAISDPHQETTTALAQQYSVRVLEVGDALLDPRIECIAIATQPSRHFALAKEALQARKHVFVEKPLTLCLHEAEELVEIAQARGLRLMTGHVLQYHPAFIKLRELVQGGRLGRLLHIHANRLNLGAIRREEDVLWCLGPHDLSMILSLVESEPVSIEAVGACHLREDIADSVTVHLRFACGVQAQVCLSWLHPFKEQRLTVVGTEAMAVFDDGEPWERKLTLFRHQIATGDVPMITRAKAEPIEVAPAEPLAAECQHFLDCVESGSDPLTGGAESLRVMRVLAGASDAMLRPGGLSRNAVRVAADAITSSF